MCAAVCVLWSQHASSWQIRLSASPAERYRLSSAGAILRCDAIAAEIARESTLRTATTSSASRSPAPAPVPGPVLSGGS